MIIDENKTEFDLSDHHLITITLNTKPEREISFANEIKTIEYLQITGVKKKKILADKPKHKWWPK